MGEVQGLTKSARAWLLGGVIALVFAGAAMTRADPDLWGHVRFGLDTLETRHLTSVDPYSFTQDLPWMNHEWLSEVLMAAVYALAGAAGLALLKAALAMAVLVVVWTGLSGLRLAGRVMVALVLIMGTVHMWATVRPQLWSLLCLAVLCRVLVSDRGTLWRMPPVFVVWANCHGGWIVGLGVLSAWAFGSVVRSPHELRKWSLILGACLLATLVTPYGWTLWAFMVRTIRVRRSIEEWGPLWGTPWLNWLPWVAACVAVAWTNWPFSWSNLRDRLRPTLVLAMLAFGAARVMKIESLFVTAAAILLGPALAARWPARRIRAAAPPVASLTFAALGAAMMIAAIPLAARTTRCVHVLGDWVPDPETARILESAQPGRLVTYFDWGEYALWHFGPSVRVSMDGGRENVYSDARLAEHDAIVAGSPDGLAILESWRPEYVWLPATSVATKRWLVSHGYRIDADTFKAFVAVRRDLPVLTPPAEPAPPACFPG